MLTFVPCHGNNICYKYIYICCCIGELQGLSYCTGKDHKRQETCDIKHLLNETWLHKRMHSSSDLL